MFSKFAAISVMIAAPLAVSSTALEAMPVYGIEEAVVLAQERNPDILIAHKKVTAARGGFIEARSGYLPSLSSSGLYDKRQTESQTNLRQEDYNAIVKLEQNLYTGGAVGSFIGALDASLVLQAVVGGVDLSPQQTIAADVNNDGQVGTLDAYHILRLIVGNISLPFANPEYRAKIA
jgi:hypothetical protein